MGMIFHRKTTSIMFVAATLVLLMLVCMLLVSLTQLSSLNARAEALKDMIQRADNDAETLRQELADREDIEYVIKWAEAHGRISQEDVQWLKSEVLGN